MAICAELCLIGITCESSLFAAELTFFDQVIWVPMFWTLNTGTFFTFHILLLH